MIKLYTNDNNYYDDLLLIVNLFKEYKKSLIVNCIVSENKIEFKLNKKVYNYNFLFKTNKEIKNWAKIKLFTLLKKYTKISDPWGAITGIRPTKIFYELLKENNFDLKKVKSIFKKHYQVSTNKINLICSILVNQNRLNIQNSVEKNDNFRLNHQVIKNNINYNILKSNKILYQEVNKIQPTFIDYFIFIPFCPSKCYYCSFISSSINACQNLVLPYINALIKEIRASLKIIKQNNFKVRNIYIGGGTPTSLTNEQLHLILSEIKLQFDEFTVECGRPDTITKEKLDTLSKFGVTRISINPQTFNDVTLKNIGRLHTSDEIINAYNLSKNYNFSVNMDIIAGLDKEKFSDFKNTIKILLKLSPDNITVHTLSIKRASTLKTDGGDISSIRETKKMIDYSIKTLQKFLYKPYYLYKQKNMIGNLENVGYYKTNLCNFNINSMEECSSIMAVGSNAISKLYITKENRIERLANVKNIEDYINRIDELIDKKINFFKQ